MQFSPSYDNVRKVECSTMAAGRARESSALVAREEIEIGYRMHIIYNKKLL